MQMRFSPLFSGSNGNSIYVEMGDARILIDAGVSGSRIVNALLTHGVTPDMLDGILLTHEHSDHVSGAGILSRKYDIPLYATRGTWALMAGKLGKVSPSNIRELRAFEDFYIGRMGITPFPLPHDAAEPVGYCVAWGGRRVAVATDIGTLRGEWLEAVTRCDLVLLESNHDVNMLKAGRYPYDLKRRILGSHGHLSNEDAGRAAVRLAESGVGHIVLGHLSGENNFPQLALRAVSDALEAEGFRPGLDIGLDVAKRNEPGGVYTLSAEDSRFSRTEGQPFAWF